MVIGDPTGARTLEVLRDVRADGAGFPASAGRGTGLRGMVDRCEAIGGELEVRSCPGAGTTVRAGAPKRGDGEP